MAVRSVPVLITVAALLGLGACGGVSVAAGAGQAAPAPAPASAARGSLCADGRGADRVVVNRAAPPPRNVPRNVTRTVTLSGATQVRALVAALCALPAMPAGQHCPSAGSGGNGSG